MRVFRLHIRPKGGLEDPVRSFAYCVRNGVLGMGWQADVPPGGALTWEEYLKLGSEAHGGVGKLSRVRFLHDQVRLDDLIWTRDTMGRYYLAQVQSPWEYLDSAEGRDVEIVNIVRCRLLQIPQADDVPGKIVACFRATRAIQSITDATAVFYSQLLWNQLASVTDYVLPRDHRHNIFAYLDAESTEDVIFIYLQIHGWIVVPNSRKADTMAYEFVAIHRDTHERALVQVKTGATQMNVGVWGNFTEKVFLFQASGNYEGEPAPNVVALSPKMVEEFMQTHIQVMPHAIQRWVKHCGSGEGRSAI